MKKVLYKISITEKNQNGEEIIEWIRNNEEMDNGEESESRFTLEELEIFFNVMESNIEMGSYLGIDLKIQVFPFVE